MWNCCLFTNHHTIKANRPTPLWHPHCPWHHVSGHVACPHRRPKYAGLPWVSSYPYICVLEVRLLPKYLSGRVFWLLPVKFKYAEVVHCQFMWSWKYNRPYYSFIARRRAIFKMSWVSNQNARRANGDWYEGLTQEYYCGTHCDGFSNPSFEQDMPCLRWAIFPSPSFLL